MWSGKARGRGGKEVGGGGKGERGEEGMVEWGGGQQENGEREG